MLKSILVLSLMIVSHVSVAQAGAETCYKLSEDGVAYSKTPQMLCVSETSPEGTTTLSLRTVGLGFSLREVAKFELDRLSRAKCLDCNLDVYGIENPTNSIFNQLQIKFNGIRPFQFDGTRTTLGKESGTVSIGATVFHYSEY